jgi:anti-sigma B factor antagonist
MGEVRGGIMQLDVTRNGDRMVVAFTARVDLEGEISDRFKNQLKDVVAQGGKHLVVDLGHVGFIDSCGLGALISALKVLRTSGGSLVLANVSAPVEAVLRITRLSRVFEICPDVSDALVLSATQASSADDLLR